MKKLKEEKAYLEPECKLTEFKTYAVLCASIEQSGTIIDPFFGATEELW